MTNLCISDMGRAVEAIWTAQVKQSFIKNKTKAELKGPCLVPWSYTQGLSWFPWLLLPLRAMLIPGIWSATWDDVGIWGTCYHQGHTDPCGLHCHQDHGDIWTSTAAEDRVWVQGPVAARVCTDLCNKNHVCWNLGTVLSWHLLGCP